jgi:hypothetical protein
MPLSFPKNNSYILDDSELYDPKFSDVCTKCKHLNVSSAMNTGWPNCRAFKNGIPKEIWYGKNKHTQPYPNDHGIQFDPIILK